MRFKCSNLVSSKLTLQYIINEQQHYDSIFLHGSIKHIMLDVKNIKDTFNFMARYISNKQVDHSKTNDLKDFNGISKAI